MAQEHAVTLAKKIESASIDISIYPRLEELVSVLAKACVATLAEATNASVQLVKMNTSMADGQGAVSDVQSEAPLYCAAVSGNEQTLFVRLSAGFAASLSESLLGGEFKQSEQEVSLTSLDVELAKPTVDNFLIPLVLLRAEDVGGGCEGSRCSVQTTTIDSDIVKNQQCTAYFNVSFDLSVDDVAATEVVTLYLPVEFLERCGLFTANQKRTVVDDEQSRWRLEMETNIKNSDIELDIVIDRYKATLCELSKLEIGQVICLSDNADQSLDITLVTDSGKCSIGEGRLGMVEKSKAIKISTLIDPCLL